VIFILGFILSGTISDYKESEKIPVEIANSIENIYEEGLYSKKMKKEFNINKFKKRLISIIDSFDEDLRNKSRTSMVAISELSESMTEMEKIGAASSASRIRSEQSNIRKNLMRTYQIKETSFIPAAYAILEILTAGIII